MPILFLLLACAAPGDEPSTPGDSPQTQLTETSRLSLASVEQGRAALGERDVYIDATSDLERQIRLRSEQPVSADEFVDHVSRQVIPWEEEDQKRLLAVAEALAEKMAEFEIPLPEEVLLIQSTGKDESGAAYTRGNAIVFSQKRAAGRDAGLERLLAHELFHVISRHDAKLRRKLYAIIGFAPCDPIALPEELAAVKITNPDAPTLNYFITIEHEGDELKVVPILLCDRNTYDPNRKSLFNYLQFRLLAVEQGEGGWAPLLKDGEPILIDGKSCQSYRRQIGDNTNYIIHPDEILADNFTHLLMRTKDLKSPEIVEQMKAILAKSDRASPHE